MFQTWETTNICEMKKLTESWISHNPTYKYHLFDEDMRKKCIKEHFDENIYRAYCRIIPGGAKADLWRFCVLYIYGGVYIDIDTFCYNSIDIFLNEEIEFMSVVDLNNSPNIGKHNLFCTFIATIPKHPILLDSINRIVYHVEKNIIPHSCLDFTGPGVLGRATNTYLHLDEETSFVGKEGYHDNGKIYLLHFENGIEYVKDENNNILLQNKNGNPEIKKIYHQEISKLSHYVDWGFCKNPIKPLFYIEFD